MAKIQPRKKQVRKQNFLATQAELPKKTNYLIILIGIAVIIVGYLVMQAGDDISPLSVTVAPVILIIGYCVIVPFGIFYSGKREETK